MKVEILDIDKLIKVNRLKEVTSANVWSAGRSLLDPKGVLSNEIFGLKNSERRSTFAYISLNRYFIHPHVYDTILKRLCQKSVFIVSGTKKFKVINGVLTEDPTGWTGLAELYKHWDEIDWNKSSSTNEKALELLSKSTKDKIFVNKWPVCPAGFRDITPANVSSASDIIPEINNEYRLLIRTVESIGRGGLFADRQYRWEANIQDCLVRIYIYFRELLSGKNGYIKRYLLGKSINYGTRSVISAPSYNNETLEENIIDIEHSAIPIAQCCATFKPFISAWLKNFFTREIITQPNLVTFHNQKTGKLVVGSIRDPHGQFTDDVIDNIINTFVRNPNGRFTLVTVFVDVRSANGKKDIAQVNLNLIGKQILNTKQVIDLKRPMTITDLLYLACVDSCEKRHMMISRYPVGTDKGIFFSKIRVQSTKKHIRVIFNGKEYPFYPDIDLKSDKNLIGVQFIDTTVYSNSFLKGLG